ncbi:MAG: hypothetical protein LAT80_14790 [Balneolaceae bacterium]|nr:hypothetical protein [Saccharospirillum sp.]MCH8550136.1 hypothetical protein [Balneolaceae bacterium]
MNWSKSFQTIKITALLLCLTPIVFSEPNSTTRYLINEPVSMMDWGIFKLNGFFQNGTDYKYYGADRGGVNVSYRWNENEILIAHTMFLKNQATTDEANALCSSLLKDSQMRLGVNPSTGELRHGMGPERFFVHSGYASSLEPDDLNEQIASIMRIQVSVMSKHEGDMTYSYDSVCESKLVSTRVLFSESPY